VDYGTRSPSLQGEILIAFGMRAQKVNEGMERLTMKGNLRPAASPPDHGLQADKGGQHSDLPNERQLAIPTRSNWAVGGTNCPPSSKKSQGVPK
jgi:hypothetical protein